METGAFTGYVDVAQVVLYLFWIFFFGLVIWLHREGKREGYPLENDREGGPEVYGFPMPPPPKTYLLPHGGSVTVPYTPSQDAELKAQPTAPWAGSPILPTGDPLQDGVGPAAYPARSEEPDRTLDGRDMIVPMRLEPGYSIIEQDPDPRGLDVVGCDGASGGTISDVWIDRSDHLIRYFEITQSGGAPSAPTPGVEGGAEDTAPAAGASITLVPYNFAHIVTSKGQVRVNALTGAQIAAAPGPKNPDQVTMREEDRISAYFGGGYLYATPERAEPLI